MKHFLAKLCGIGKCLSKFLSMCREFRRTKLPVMKVFKSVESRSLLDEIVAKNTRERVANICLVAVIVVAP